MTGALRLHFAAAAPYESSMTGCDRDRIIGVVLAGGLSRRMGGGDKGLASLGTSTMLDEVIRRLSPQVSRIVLNANGDPIRFAQFGVPVVSDPVTGFAGPLAGVLAGLCWTSAEAPVATHVLTASSDTPFLPDNLAVRLVQALADQPSVQIALASSAGCVHPVIGLWPIALADDLEAALRAGLRKVLDWAERHGVVAVDFPMHETFAGPVDPFLNANTPAELDEARRLLPFIRS